MDRLPIYRMNYRLIRLCKHGLYALILTGNLWAPGKLEARSNQPDRFPDRIILNLPEDPDKAVCVTWRTDPGITRSFCEIQEATAKIDPSKSRTVEAQTKVITYTYPEEPPVPSARHSCRIDGLEPGKTYMYRVGAPGLMSEWFHFQTPSAGGSFSFLYFGDPQTELRSQWSRAIREAYRFCADCGFMLYGGDMINRAGRDTEWQEWFEAGSFLYASVPQVMTPGNHDYRDRQLDPHWNAQFTLPENGPSILKGTCYFIDYKNLKLISIDSAAGDELEEEDGRELLVQKAWLDSVLRTNTKEWVIVTTHVPFYSPKESRDNPLLRKHFQPLLEKYGVDLVLSGHDHSYGRGRATDTPGAKPSVVYVVSVSGPKMYEAGDKSWMEKKGENMQLFQKITIDGNILDFKAYTVTGELFDAFRLRKKPNGKAKFKEISQMQ